MTTAFRYRPELDGIRALAVIAVIVYHLDSAWLPGGYLGVDVFFVMSGYLITSLLVIERRASGGIALLGFWSRRARRLLPAMVAMVVVVAVYYTLFVSDLERIGLRGDLIATLFYVSNWHFVSSGQSYFEQFVGSSPVRHTWSLAIEEQFYLVWPVVVAVVLRWRRTGTLAALAGIGLVTSVAAMALLFDAADPSRAYFGTGARIHQMLLGVLLALALQGRWASDVRRIGRGLVVPAALALGAAVILIDDTAPFYYRGGSFAVALAATCLIAGLEGGHPIGRPLAWRPLVVIGVVSYGLYLWHWPVITAISFRWGPTSEVPLAVVAVLVTVVLTVVSYKLIERPVRMRQRLFGQTLRPGFVLATVPVVTLLALMVVLSSTRGVRVPEWASDSASPAALDSVLRAESPASARSLIVDQPTIGVVGDSVMVSLLPGLRDEAEQDGFSLVEAAVRACPVGYEPLYDDLGVLSWSYTDRCSVQVEPAHVALLRAQPDIVIWHDLQSVFARRSDDGTLLIAGSELWTDDLIVEWTSVLERFRSEGAEVVLVMPPLRSVDPTGDCTAAKIPARCEEIQSQDTIIRAATREFWDRIDGTDGVLTVELDDLLCPDRYPCPAQRDGVLVRIDGSDQTHFTEEGARWTAPRLLERIEQGF